MRDCYTVIVILYTQVEQLGVHGTERLVLACGHHLKQLHFVLPSNNRPSEGASPGTLMFFQFPSKSLDGYIIDHSSISMSPNTSLEHCVELESLAITFDRNLLAHSSILGMGFKILRSWDSDMVAQILELSAKPDSQFHISEFQATLRTLAQLSKIWLAGITSQALGDTHPKMQEMRRILRIRIPGADKWCLGETELKSYFPIWSRLGQLHMGHFSCGLSISFDPRFFAH